MRYKIIVCLQFLCLLLCVTANEGEQPRQVKKRGVVENFGQGLKLAGQMFGINTAADVANLVAMAFGNQKTYSKSTTEQQAQTNADDSESDATQPEQQASGVKDKHRQKQQQQQPQEQQEQDESDEQPRQPPNNSPFNTSRFVLGVLRMVGFDATKLGALAINALIMIAEVIGNAFTMPPRTEITGYIDENEGEPEVARNGKQEAHQPRALREGTPIEWYLENPNAGMRRMLNDALDSQLTDRITEMIERVEKQEGGQAGCIKLLMCKSSPIIWGMQRSVSERVTGRAANGRDDSSENNNEKAKTKPKSKKLFSTEILFTNFPTLQEFRKHSVICDERFQTQCNLNGNVHDDKRSQQNIKKQNQ